MNYSEEFEKKMKTSKGKLIVALVLVAMCLCNGLSSYFLMEKEKKNPVAYADISKEGEYTCVDVIDISDGFADYSNESSTSMSAYYGIDEEDIFIISMSSSTVKKFDAIIDYWTSDDEDLEEPDPVHICGMTETIPSNLRSLAVEYYNDMFTDNTITSTQFSQYFKYFINTEKSPFDQYAVQFSVAGLFLFAAFIVFLVYLNDVRKTKKTLAKFANELDKIKMDVASPETIYEKKAKIFLTKEYLINVAAGMEIYDYKDIIWVYPHEYRRNGYTQQRSIYIVTKDTKAHIVANVFAGKKNDTMFNELYESLLIRVPDAMHGYTQENKNKVKELSKKK